MADSKGDTRDVQSHPVKRVVSGVLAASAAIAIVNVAQTSATAAPPATPQTPALQTPQDDSSGELARYRDLAAKAEKVNEDYLRSQDNLAAKQGELEKANADLESAKQAETRARTDQDRFRVEVDRFAGASFTSGPQMHKLSALLTEESTQDFLDRSSALDVLAADKNAALGGLSAAVDQASTAQRQASDAQSRAQSAKDSAAKLTSDIEARKTSLDQQMRQLDTASSRLSSADRAKQQDTGGEAPNVQASGPAAQQAVDAALSKLGSPYVWGATGPSSFDCSGLITWAYQQAGISLPRSSSAQSKQGQSVSRDELQPGDLVFFYQPVSHVGIYIGNGKMVNAPTSGDVVKVSPLQSQYSGARRVA